MSGPVKMYYSSQVMKSRVFRLIECLLLFVVIPTAVAFGFINLTPIPSLVGLSVYGFIVLLQNPRFEFSCLWRAQNIRSNLRSVIVFFTPILATSIVVIYVFIPEQAFNFIRTEPTIWALVMVFYPFLSALPQEFLFRTFFFQRYRDVFPSDQTMIVASGVAFAYSHIILKNLIAPLLSLPVGILLAWRYQKTNSLVMVTFEHTLYGWLVFTVGYGLFFYHGAA